MSDEQVTLKLADRSDAKRVLAFLNQATQETDVILIPHLKSVDESIEALNLKTLAKQDNALVLLACLGEDVIGMLTIMPLPDQHQAGELGIMVLRDFWHQGIGSLLIDEALYWYQNFAPLEHLVLDVFKSNIRAIGLYQHYGFVPTGETEIEDAQGIKQATILMEYAN